MRNAILVSALVLATPLAGDQLRIASSDDWRQWQLPGDAVEVARGTLKPSFVRRNINAVANAFNFASGGIRKVGSNPGDALNLIDGDPATYWAPDPSASVEDWWIEVDLGRVVSARKIELHFAADSTPLEFFKILTSDGEPFFSNANSILPGTLRYNKRWRYSFNEAHLIEIDYQLNPLKNIRIEADLPTENIRLTEVGVESIGDNLSLGIWGRGGSVEIISEANSKIGRTLTESKGISNTLVDGDITTYWGTVHRGGSGTQPEQQIGQFEIDLGALYWVDRVRMLGDDSGGAPGKGSGRHRAGVFNPIEVSPGEMSQFTYYLRSDLVSSSRGFDQIQLASTAGATFRALRLAGEPVTAPVEETENGFKILLAEPVRRSTLIEIDFESTLYLNQTRFEAFLFNSALSTTLRQQVDPGDAEAAIASDRTFVSLPTDGRLFADLSLSNRVLTPNGDGISDQLQIDLDLFKMLDPRPVIIGVYNLTGHRVALISDAATTAGHQTYQWDGRDSQGRTVAPGIYILRVTAEGDALTRSENRLISVVY